MKQNRDHTGTDRFAAAPDSGAQERDRFAVGEGDRSEGKKVFCGRAHA